MGTWGTGISSNDTFQDIVQDYYELYNNGMQPEEISIKILNENQEIIASIEDSNNFWFGLAKAEWDCKSLRVETLNRVKAIVESKSDLKLWKELEATSSDIKTREKVLVKFLEKISIEKKTARRRKKKKIRNSIFKKGDCLVFKLSTNEYCGIFVLEGEFETEFGLNLIAVTDIKQTRIPNIDDFEKANVIHWKYQFGKSLKTRPDIAWYFAQNFKKSTTEFELIGNLETKKNYSPDIDFETYSHWDNFKLHIDAFYKPNNNLKSNKKLKLKKLRKNNPL